jgi:hypothetical protein
VQRRSLLGLGGGATLLPVQATESWIPTSEVEKQAVHQQLEKLLATSLFNSSKRYPSFLRFVVTGVLAGQTDQLKERILGVEIFGRHADYDTNTDPIVRVTAAEIRKRIELYYQDPKHAQEIRLFLPSGSYAPQFSWPGHPMGADSAAIEPSKRSSDTIQVHVHTPSSASDLISSKRLSSTRWKLVFVLAFLTVVVASTAIWYVGRGNVLKQFWEPFVKSPEPILFCIADQVQYSSIRLRDATDPQHETTLNDSMTAIIIDDINPLVSIAGMLHTNGKSYRLLGESATTLADLRRGPSVFIGAFDNSWTLRLTAPLRFHFANNSDMTQYWIEDRANPKKRDWILDRSQQFQTGVYKDYAIVARLVDPNTDQYVVVAAGINRGGTVAAGEFLVDQRRMSEMLNQLPRDWKQKNLEIVLETQVIQGRSGPPRISAVHVW